MMPALVVRFTSISKYFWSLKLYRGQWRSWRYSSDALLGFLHKDINLNYSWKIANCFSHPFLANSVHIRVMRSISKFSGSFCLKSGVTIGTWNKYKSSSLCTAPKMLKKCEFKKSQCFVHFGVYLYFDWYPDV